MNKTFIFSKFFFLSLLITISLALECTQILDSSIIAGSHVYIPAGATAPVAIPPNFNCTYQIKVPKMIFAHVTLENFLKGQNDKIVIRDELGKMNTVTSRNFPILQFYVFPNTITTFQVTTKSVDVGSKFHLTINYLAMPEPEVSELGSELKYFSLNDLEVSSGLRKKKPQNVFGSDKVVFTTAHFEYSEDKFDNFFIIDGSFTAQTAVYHLPDYLNQNFVSSGNNLTILGLDTSDDVSSVILSPLSEVQKYDVFLGVTTFYEIQSVQLNVPLKKGAVTVISRHTDYNTIRGIQYFTDKANCSIKAVTAPITDNSTVLLDFATITTFPYTLNHKLFVVVVENCNVEITMYSD